ncbi:hypothetical protein BDZ89DRAFT_1056789, partial [Hymenopellis radicata]
MVRSTCLNERPPQAKVDAGKNQQTLDRIWADPVICRTCRLRRKVKHRFMIRGLICRRLTIECLGWGAKRPEWMRVSIASNSALRVLTIVHPQD